MLLQYSDLATTALVADSVYSLSKAVKVKPAIAEVCKIVH